MFLASRQTGGVVRIDVVTGGSGYEEPPVVTISDGGGTGAAAVAHMAGTRVEAVIITNGGTGYSSNPTVAFTASTGTGAAASAYAYAGTLRPVSFFKGRHNELYGVDGMGRGFRWVDEAGGEPSKLISTEGGSFIVTEGGLIISTVPNEDLISRPIGLVKPAVAPAVTASSTSNGKLVAAVQMVDNGAGYSEAPTVVFTGGTPTKDAKAQAVITDGRVSRVVVTDVGAGFQSPPRVSFEGGLGQGATFGVQMLGKAATVRIINPGADIQNSEKFTYPINLGNPQGLTGFAALAIADNDGKVAGARLLAAGTGATATGQTLEIEGGNGAEAALDVVFSIATVTAAFTGSGFYVKPVITVERDPEDQPPGEARFSDAVLEPIINGLGNVIGATVVSGGQYSLTPRVYVADSGAEAQATLRDPFVGKYFCAIRYLDDTPEVEAGPIPSSLSDIAEIDMGSGGGAIHWSFSHYGVDDRVVAMELWRSTAGQRTVFFRVATIQRDSPEWDGTYVDTLGDDQITDPSRDGYGLLPITLPSGQVNARRFEVPPGEFSVACMFQDRAWYAVDTLGLRPNSLMFSEIDEPESVPPDNELVLQENSVSSDQIVALIPFSTMLIVAQRNHLYKLMYVSQPIIDASLTLAVYRGVLNDRCWTVMAGIAFLVDDTGMYAFDGSREEPVSAPIDNYWRDGIIDFSKVNKFHVSSDLSTRIVRFHYCKSGDTEPTRALCFSAFTKAWWEEEYPTACTATSPAVIGSKLLRIQGTVDGGFRKFSGLNDDGTGITYQYRTPPMPLAENPDGSVTVVYKPTVSDVDLQMGLHYNNSPSPRANAVRTDRGAGFVRDQGETYAHLNMSVERSELGDATGVARASFVAQRNDRSAGADRHVAIAFAGTQSGSTTGDEVVIHAVQVDGVG